MAPPSPERTDDAMPDDGRVALRRALSAARQAIFWERLWPALASLATAAGLFLVLSWLGLWLWLPPLGRAVGVFVFFVLAVAAAVPLFLVRMPSSNDGLRRLDRMSRLPHRPATAIADELANAGSDPHAIALWRAHVERALRAARLLKVGLPTPRLAARDPYALRALVLLLAVATFFSAAGERTERIAAAFDWQGVVPPANYRIDAWVTPPIYTGRPPVMLPGVRPGEPTRESAEVSVPAGSTLVVRGTGRSNLDVAVTGGVVEAQTAAEDRPAAPAGTTERRFTIEETGTASMRGSGGNLVWSFEAIPDRDPTIELAREPEGQARGALLLAYRVEDDYGVVEAHGSFERPATRADAPAKPPRPLFGAPEFPLVLPQARTRKGVGQTIRDVSDHPWAGTEVTLTLVARDEAGNEGRSKPHTLVLPQRPFNNVLARALIEQRRELALNANARKRVLTALDALTLAPERFTPEAGIYLGLRSIYWQLTRARRDDDLRDVVARLWSMAVTIEDGNMSEIERALRAAQDALREALERGASDEEIRKLMDQLRAALDRFLQALAEELRKNPQMARPLDPNNSRMLRSQDLQSMIDRMERLARSGARDAARQMLEQLRQMLENLQMARPGGEMGQGEDDMSSALDELGEMIRRQQELRDRTFRRGQEQRGQQSQGDRQMGDLRQDQQALRERLNQLLQELKRRGMPVPGQSGNEMNQLGSAGEAMGDAQGQLGEGDADGAVDSQGRALDALRRGAQGLAQTLQQQMGEGQGPGRPGRMGRSGRADQETDPLGRPLRGRDYGDDTSVRVPGEIEAQRARRILEELRRRFGESFRPQLELDYIERLLRDF